MVFLRVNRRSESILGSLQHIAFYVRSTLPTIGSLQCYQNQVLVALKNRSMIRSIDSKFPPKITAEFDQNKPLQSVQILQWQPQKYFPSTSQIVKGCTTRFCLSEKSICSAVFIYAIRAFSFIRTQIGKGLSELSAAAYAVSTQRLTRRYETKQDRLNGGSVDT